MSSQTDSDQSFVPFNTIRVPEEYPTVSYAVPTVLTLGIYFLKNRKPCV